MTCNLVRQLLPCVGSTLSQELLDQLNSAAQAEAATGTEGQGQ